MDNHDMLQSHTWKPFAPFGLTGDFWTLQADTIRSTLLILGLIITISLFVNRCLQNKKSLVRFVALQYVYNFQDLLKQTLKESPINHLSFIASLFTFILFCNTIQIFPYFEEPTKDINTTLALGLISFFYVQFYSLKVNGLKAYMAEFFEPFVIMFPLHVVGKITSIISLSFRLFGNIFGGFIISSLYAKVVSSSVFLETFALMSGMNLAMLFVFGMFEGVIQAFVFAMLTLTYLSMELVHESEEEESETNSNEKVSA